MKKLLGILGLFVVLGVVCMADAYKPGIYHGSSTSKHGGFKYTNFAVIHVDDSGVIDNVYIDATYPIDSKDLSKGYTTLQLLGDDYGMRKASKIGKEWNEQANAIAASVVKNQGIGYSVKKNKRTDDIAGATMRVDAYTKAIKEALEKAKK